MQLWPGCEKLHRQHYYKCPKEQCPKEQYPKEACSITDSEEGFLGRIADRAIVVVPCLNSYTGVICGRPIMDIPISMAYFQALKGFCRRPMGRGGQMKAVCTKGARVQTVTAGWLSWRH